VPTLPLDTLAAADIGFNSVRLGAANGIYRCELSTAENAENADWYA